MPRLKAWLTLFPAYFLKHKTSRNLLLYAWLIIVVETRFLHYTWQLVTLQI